MRTQCTEKHTHTHSDSFGKQVEGVGALYFFHQWCAKSIYKAAIRRLEFACMFVCECVCVRVRICISAYFWAVMMHMYVCRAFCFIFIRAYIFTDMRLCICAVWHSTVLSAWLNIFSAHSLAPLHPPTYPPSLFLFSLTLTPSSPSRSAWLARTCMSVDSVLCLLPWHAPTSLQCSPVCINWQRDSGYVVCRAGRIEKRKKGGGDARGDVRTQ